MSFVGALPFVKTNLMALINNTTPIVNIFYVNIIAKVHSKAEKLMPTQSSKRTMVHKKLSYSRRPSAGANPKDSGKKFRRSICQTELPYKHKKSTHLHTERMTMGKSAGIY